MKEREGQDTPDEMEAWKNMPRVPRWFRMGRRSLTGKMMILFCAVILPINLLMVFITGFVTRTYEQRIAESYAYRLSIYGQAAENQFVSMEQDMRDFLSIDNLVILTRGSTSDSTLDMIRFHKALSGSDVWDTYPGLYYVWDKEKDIMGFANMNRNYSQKTTHGLEEMIRENTKNGSGRNQKEFLVSGQEAFLLERYDYDFFSIGILFDVESILGQFCDQEEQPGTLYLVDDSDKLLAEAGADGFRCQEVQGEVKAFDERSELVVSNALGFGGYKLVHRTRRSEYMKDLRAMITVLYILCGGSFVAIPLLCLFVVRLVSNPVKKLCLSMEEVESGNLEYQVEGETGTYEMDFLCYSFNHMVDELHHLVTESYVKEIERLKTDSINIRLQVNQHMLLNFLNTIYSLSCTGKTEQASEFTLLLMNYFRYVLRQDIGLVTIKEEMQFVRDYLKLQKIRFPDSFHCVYAVEEGADELRIPQLLIQNFVENTIKYGLILGKEIEILINVRTEDERLILSICDTGNGMQKERARQLQRGEIIEDRNGKHIGIWNCKRRLKYYYGEQQKMTVTSSPNEGTQVWIEMLKEPLEKEEAAYKVHRMEKAFARDEADSGGGAI